MKRKLVAMVLVFCFFLGMMPLTVAAKPTYKELNPDDFIYEYSSNKESCPDDNQYDFAIFSKTIPEKFLLVPKYKVQLVFLVYDAEKNVCASYVSENSFWFNEPESIDEVIKKDKKLADVAALYKQVLEAECQFLILEEVEAGKDTAPQDQIDRLKELKEDILGDFKGIVSDFQYEFLESILTSGIDQANSVFQSASKADPVIEFFKMVFLDLFGLDDSGEDFHSHVAKMAGESAFDAQGYLTNILYDSLEFINPEEIYSIYKDQYTIARGEIIAIIMELNETPVE